MRCCAGAAASGWEFENAGSAPTFLNGQQVTRVTVDRPLDLVLGSADGPVLHVEPAVPVAPPASPDQSDGYAALPLVGGLPVASRRRRLPGGFRPPPATRHRAPPGTSLPPGLAGAPRRRSRRARRVAA